MKKPHAIKQVSLSQQQEAALNLLLQAKGLLLNQLHTPRLVSIELAEGIDKLLQAFELVEKPLSKILICPICQNIYYGKPNADQDRCLSCGMELVKQ